MISKITVYTKNNCPRCDMTKMVLDRKGIEYKLINIEDDTKEGKEGYSHVVDVLQLFSLPVVVIEGQEPFTGFQPDKLEGLK